MGSLFTYWLLKLLLLVILVFCGYGISYYRHKDFMLYAVIAALFYSVIEGLRWDRGADYMHYYNDIIGKWGTPDPEFLYKIIVDFLSVSIRLPYWCIFIVYSLLLISSVLLIFKVYPKSAVWGLPLFFIITDSSAENIIRQYLAISFVIFAYYAYLKNKRILTAVLLCCVPMIHLSGLIAVVVFVLLALFRVPLKNPLILLAVYLALYFFWDISYFSGITDFLSTFSLGDDIKMQNYLENSERWFSYEGSISNVLYGENAKAASLTNMVITVFSQMVIIYYGFKAQLRDRRLQIAFYFTYTAILFNVIGGDIEMYSRFYNWYIYLTPFILGIAIYKVPMMQYERYAVLAILFVNYYLYGFFRFMGSLPYHGFAFVWDG